MTNEALDNMYQKIVECGGWGAKLLGAGGGGYFVVFAPFEAQQRIKTELKKLGVQIEPFVFDLKGIQTWSSNLEA